MGLIEAIRVAEKIIEPSPLGLDTICMMGMIRRYKDRVYVMIMPPLETVENKGDAANGFQPALEP